VHVTAMREERNAQRILMANSRRRVLIRPRSGWKGNVERNKS
jgi:hypothetical protein